MPSKVFKRSRPASANPRKPLPRKPLPPFMAAPLGNIRVDYERFPMFGLAGCGTPPLGVAAPLRSGNQSGQEFACNALFMSGTLTLPPDEHPDAYP